MATPISHAPRPHQRHQDSEAFEELHQLIRLLHEKNILRLINNTLGAEPTLITLAAELLDREASRRFILNITRLIDLLSEIDASRADHLIDAFNQGVEALELNARDTGRQTAGISALLSLLRDQELWQAITGIAAFLKAFNRGLKT